LGPREVYVPSYPVSRNYVNNVNVSNTTVNTTVVNNYYNSTVVNENVNVTNMKYVNQTVPGAVAATTSQAFTTAQPVAKNAVNVDQHAIATASVRAFAPASVPTKQAVLGTGAVTVAAKPPAAVRTRAVVGKVAPPPPPPVFEKQQEAIRDNGGKPLTAAQIRQIQPAPPQSAAPVKIIAPAPVKVAPQQGAQGEQTPNNPALGNKPALGQPGQSKKAAQMETNRPATVITREENRPAERPANLNNAAPHADADRPAPPLTHPSGFPPVGRTAPSTPANPQPDQKHQQEQKQPRATQQQERPQVHQRQEPEHTQLAQQGADEPKKQQIEQHQQQTVPMEEKRTQEPQKSQEKQQPAGKNQSKPSKDDRPPNGKP
jgi:hypothetical protein